MEMPLKRKYLGDRAYKKTLYKARTSAKKRGSKAKWQRHPEGHWFPKGG